MTHALGRRGTLCLLLAAALLVTGCKRNEERPAAPAPKPPVAGLQPSLEWLEGRLPADVGRGEPKRGGTLTIRVHNEPPHLSSHVLDPRDLVATRITIGRVYDTLLKVDAKDHPRYGLRPSAAESWEESKDHLTYTFHLRRGMKFHDGRPVTAHDVEATMAAILDPELPTGSTRSFFVDVAEQKALDEHTYRVKLKKPYFLFLRQIATDVPIMPKHLLASGDFRTNPLHRAPVGSGPWKFVEWKKLHSITLARNEAYWGPKPHLDTLVFRIVPDHTVATQLFERGEFDVMTQIQHSVWVDMDRSEKLVRDFHRIRFFPNNYEWVGWNQDRPFFADKRVRTALALLFDRDTFNRTVLQNLEKPTACHFFHAGPDCDPALTPLPYDPARARRLLTEAGWVPGDDGIRSKDGRKFRFTFLVPSNSVFLSKLVVHLKEAYRKEGIEMEIARAEWSVFTRRLIERDFDACSLLWGTNDATNDPYQTWHSSQIDG
ncbi:MAG: ABC transporter substrate-binding protein, partial [Myxococcales bacterium]